MASKRNRKASAVLIRTYKKKSYLALTKSWNPFFDQVTQFSENNQPVMKIRVKFALKKQEVNGLYSLVIPVTHFFLIVKYPTWLHCFNQLLSVTCVLRRSQANWRSNSVVPLRVVLQPQVLREKVKY